MLADGEGQRHEYIGAGEYSGNENRELFMLRNAPAMLSARRLAREFRAVCVHCPQFAAPTDNEDEGEDEVYHQLLRADADVWLQVHVPHFVPLLSNPAHVVHFAARAAASQALVNSLYH